MAAVQNLYCNTCCVCTFDSDQMFVQFPPGFLTLVSSVTLGRELCCSSISKSVKEDLGLTADRFMLNVLILLHFIGGRVPGASQRSGVESLHLRSKVHSAFHTI